MTVGELREAIQFVPDTHPVVIHVQMSEITAEEAELNERVLAYDARQEPTPVWGQALVITL